MRARKKITSPSGPRNLEGSQVPHNAGRGKRTGVRLGFRLFGSRKYGLRKRLALAFDQMMFEWRDRRLAQTFAALPLEEIDRIPKINGEMPRCQVTEPLVFVACDTVYFANYAPPLLRSMNRYSPGAEVHFHIFNPTLREVFEPIKRLRQECDTLRISLSWENVDFSASTDEYARVYYSSMRFVRLYQIFVEANRDILLLDVDSLVRGRLETFWTRMRDADVTFRSRFSHPDPKRRMLAGVMGLRNNNATMAYLRSVAWRTALHLLKASHPPQWYLDQRLLMLEFNRRHAIPNELKYEPLSATYIDWHYRDSSAIWVGKGNRKQSSQKYQSLMRSLSSAAPSQSERKSPKHLP